MAGETTTTTKAATNAAGKAGDAKGQSSSDKRKLVAIEVISRQDGFWRGDRQWTHEPQTVQVSELTDEQFADIVGEPLLIVREIYDDTQ